MVTLLRRASFATTAIAAVAILAVVSLQQKGPAYPPIPTLPGSPLLGQVIVPIHIHGSVDTVAGVTIPADDHNILIIGDDGTLVKEHRLLTDSLVKEMEQRFWGYEYHEKDTTESFSGRFFISAGEYFSQSDAIQQKYDALLGRRYPWKPGDPAGTNEITEIIEERTYYWMLEPPDFRYQVVMGFEKQEVCGDGVVDTDEQCDDGNTSNEDLCTNTCRAAVCGDGFVQQVTGEECDDGNVISGDGCSSECLNECVDSDGGIDYYTPGIVRVGQEEYEDFCSEYNIVNEYYCSENEAMLSSHECSDDCDQGACISTDSDCGNGTIEGGEECDDGNMDNGDECSSTCQEQRVLIIEEMKGLEGGDVYPGTPDVPLMRLSIDNISEKDIRLHGILLNDNEQEFSCGIERYELWFDEDGDGTVDNYLVSDVGGILHFIDGFLMPARTSVIAEIRGDISVDAEPGTCMYEIGLDEDEVESSDSFVRANTVGTLTEIRGLQIDDGLCYHVDGPGGPSSSNCPKHIITIPDSARPRWYVRLCGNGIIDEMEEFNEECDDGNSEDEDGCSRTCEIEDAWRCSGEPSECDVLIPWLPQSPYAKCVEQGNNSQDPECLTCLEYACDQGHTTKVALGKCYEHCYDIAPEYQSCIAQGEGAENPKCGECLSYYCPTADSPEEALGTECKEFCMDVTDEYQSCIVQGEGAENPKCGECLSYYCPIVASPWVAFSECKEFCIDVTDEYQSCIAQGEGAENPVCGECLSHYCPIVESPWVAFGECYEVCSDVEPDFDCLEPGTIASDPDCALCLEDACGRGYSATESFNKCSVYCFDAAPDYLSCTAQGEGAEKPECAYCLSDECTTNTAPVSIGVCHDYCFDVTEDYLSCTAQGEGAENPVCAYCLSDECTTNTAPVSIGVCHDYCFDVTSGYLSCVAQSEGISNPNCKVCLTNLCENDTPTVAFSQCEEYCVE